MPKKNILLTGLPRSGKTTVIIKIAEYLKGDCCGFFTREIKHHGRRQGFQIVSVADPCQKKTLAHVSFSSKYKVSKYGVAPEALNPFIKELYKNMETKKMALRYLVWVVNLFPGMIIFLQPDKS